MRIGKACLVWALVCLAGLLIWLPLWMLFSGSVTGAGELSQNLGPVLLPDTKGFAAWPLLPKLPTMRAYVELLLDTPAFFSMFWNSCIQSFPLAAGQLLVGTPAAWAFARYDFPLKKTLFTLYAVLMLLPFQVTMVSSYLVLNSMGLIDTVWAVILPGAFSTFPVFLMTRFFSAIPESVLEAAYLDGAGPVRAFFQVGIPLGAPGLVSAVTLGFLDAWNAIEPPLAFLKTKSLWPLPLFLPSISAENAALSLAASVIMLIPPLLVFRFGQPYLEQGLAASGVKE